MASAVKQNLKIVAYVHKIFNNLLFPKIEALSPYATIVNAGYDIEYYNEENLKDANVLVLQVMLDMHLKYCIQKCQNCNGCIVAVQVLIGCLIQVGEDFKE